MLKKKGKLTVNQGKKIGFFFLIFFGGKMVQLFLSEAVSLDIGNGIAAKERISVLQKLEPVIWSVITSCGRSEARLWLCNAISCIHLITPHEQCELFMDLLKSVSQKRILAAQLLQKIFEKKPHKAGPIIAKKRKMLQKFFKGNPRRVLQWFGNFAGPGESEHRQGAKAISQFAFVNRDICWEDLKWKGKHGQSPAMVATKPHYFLDLDVLQTVENFLENVPDFWSSDELAESLKDGSILLLDMKFFIDCFTDLMYEQKSEDLWMIVNEYLLEEQFSFLCRHLLILLGERELRGFLNSVGKFLALRTNFKDYGCGDLTWFKYSPSYWLEILLLTCSDCPPIDELLLLNSVINQGRQLLRLIHDDEHAVEKDKIEELVPEINRGTSDINHWTLMNKCVEMKKSVVIKWLGLQSWVIHYSLSKECKTPESCESLFIRNGISFRRSDDYSMVHLDELLGDSGSGLDDGDLVRDRRKKRKIRKIRRKKKNRRDDSSGDELLEFETSSRWRGLESRNWSWLISTDEYSSAWNSADLPEHLAGYCFFIWMKWVISNWKSTA